MVEARTEGTRKFELLPVEAGFGLTRLPEPSDGDVFLDLEGDPFVGEHGLEYLFGYLFEDVHGAPVYEGDWALTRADEKRAFEAFIDFVMARWAQFPGLHIYHYAPYEPAALKRLMGRYATREEELDRMLRARLFVDLYQVVRHSLRASVESYSIKRLEPFYGFERETPLTDANVALANLQANLELSDAPSIAEETKAVVRAYNEDDCRSAMVLRDWLERPGFLQVLTGQLVTKQILFLGFSFTDPNIAHLFASIREAFKDNGPEDYAIVRRPKKGSGAGAKKRFETEKIRHALWVQDLRRYGIACVEVDEYEEIDEILRAVELRLASRSVFVSGSLPEDAPDDQRRRIEDVARHVGRVIAERQKRLISGFGLTVGSAAIAGALDVILKELAPNLEKSLLLRPFPLAAPAGLDLATFRTRYREGMIQHAGVAVFIGGLKVDAGSSALVAADGVIEEFETAQRLGRVVVPVGATGGAAAEIWKRMDKAGVLPRGLKRADFDGLNNAATSAQDIAKIAQKVFDAADKPKPRRAT